MKSINPILSVFIVVCIGMVGSARPDSTDYRTQKGALLERLDSIDMEKQVRKRTGLPLEDLETKSLLIKDSIATLKKNVRSADKKPGAAASREKPGANLFRGNRFLPGNAFDWVVFVLALIALIAGAILCAGVVSMVWKKTVMKKKPLFKTMSQYLSLRDERAIRRDPAPPGGTASELPNGALDALKKRMSAAPEIVPALSGAFASPAPEPPVRNPATGDGRDDIPDRKGTPPSSSAEESRASDMTTAIIKAASEGADVTEISKRFHVGVDQVVLILRVSHRDTSRQENGK